VGSVENFCLEFDVFAGSIHHLETMLRKSSVKHVVDLGIFDGGSFKLDAMAFLKGMDNITAIPSFVSFGCSQRSFTDRNFRLFVIFTSLWSTWASSTTNNSILTCGFEFGFVSLSHFCDNLRRSFQANAGFRMINMNCGNLFDEISFTDFNIFICVAFNFFTLATSIVNSGNFSCGFPRLLQLSNALKVTFEAMAESLN
jgi:hypothetical protein